jgi:hypothetical protein
MVRSSLSGSPFPLRWFASLKMDDNGVMGLVRPSGEFQVIVPDTIPTSDRIAVVSESFDLDLHISFLSKRDEDACSAISWCYFD